MHSSVYWVKGKMHARSNGQWLQSNGQEFFCDVVKQVVHGQATKMMVKIS